MKTNSLAQLATFIGVLAAPGAYAGNELAAPDRSAHAVHQESGARDEGRSSPGTKRLAIGPLPDDEWTRTAIGAQRLSGRAGVQKTGHGPEQGNQRERGGDTVKP